MILDKKIKDKTARIGVIGLGYVGLPLSIVISKKFGLQSNIVGFDIDETRLDELRNNFDRTGEINSSDLKDSIITFSSDHKSLVEIDVFLYGDKGAKVAERIGLKLDSIRKANTFRTLAKSDLHLWPKVRRLLTYGVDSNDACSASGDHSGTCKAKKSDSRFKAKAKTVGCVSSGGPASSYGAGGVSPGIPPVPAGVVSDDDAATGVCVL